MELNFKNSKKYREKFDKSLIGEEFEIILYPIPDSTKVKIISSNIYEEIIKDMGYSGIPIALMRKSCEETELKK